MLEGQTYEFMTGYDTIVSMGDDLKVCFPGDILPFWSHFVFFLFSFHYLEDVYMSHGIGVMKD